MSLGHRSISVTLTLTNQFAVHTFIVIKYGIICLRDSYNILSDPCKFILSSMNIIIHNQEIFWTYTSIHNFNTRNKHRLLRPNTSLSCFKKSTFYIGIRIFNSIPCSLKILMNEKAKFKVTLRICFSMPSLYCVCEFFMCKDDL
jgi:hypothetical protein